MLSDDLKNFILFGQQINFYLNLLVQHMKTNMYIRRLFNLFLAEAAEIGWVFLLSFELKKSLWVGFKFKDVLIIKKTKRQI